MKVFAQVAINQYVLLPDREPALAADREPAPAKPSLPAASPAHSINCGIRQATRYHAPLIKPYNPIDLGNPYQSRSCAPDLRKPYQRSHKLSATCLTQNDIPLLNLHT
jgi:hypothetical protein